MKWKNLYEHDINLDVEVADLIMDLEEAFSQIQCDFMENFGSRQNSDWITRNGSSKESLQALSDIEAEILRRALVVIRTRWERSGN